MGIDNGGTLSKAVIFDDKGEEIANASSGLKLSTPKAGFTERDMDQLWAANCSTIRRAIANAKIQAGDIKGVACTGHGKGLYLWGKDGKPCYPGIVSMDSRAWEYPEKMEQGRNGRPGFLQDIPKDPGLPAGVPPGLVEGP